MLHYKNQSLKIAQNLKSAGWGSFSKCINFYIEFYQVREQKSPSLSCPGLPWRQEQGKQHIPEWTKELWVNGQNRILYFTLLLLSVTDSVQWLSSIHRFRFTDSVLSKCLHLPPLPSWKLFHILLQATQTAPSGTCTCPASFLQKPQHPLTAAHWFPVHSSQDLRILNGWLLPK